MPGERCALQRGQAPSPQECFPLHYREAYNAGLSFPFRHFGARMTQDQLKQAVAQAAVDFILPKLDDKSIVGVGTCLLYTSPSPRDLSTSRMPSSA